MTNIKKMGKGMMIIAWVLIIALATFLFNQYLNKQQNPNRTIKSVTDHGVKTIVLKRNRNNHYVMTGKINGHKVNFFLDTGATDVTVPIKLAKTLGLKKGYPGYARTANGIITVYSTELETLTLGNIVLHNVRASINPVMQGQVLLGMSALKNLQFTQRGDVLRISQV